MFFYLYQLCVAVFPARGVSIPLTPALSSASALLAAACAFKNR
ncbi:MAG TPA: hypothetical protein VM936_08955 [Pyrinomonadaceae bacterium]|jgi:hypothetical protein|nr:hypothetical protein [Pyrinomonadaceae bacterium]